MDPESVDPEHLEPTHPDYPDVPKGTAQRRIDRAREDAHKSVQSRIVWGLVGLVAVLAVGWAATSIAFTHSIDNQTKIIENQSTLLRRRSSSTTATQCSVAALGVFSGGVRDVILGALAKDASQEARGAAAMGGADFTVCAPDSTIPAFPTTTTTVPVPSSTP